MIKIGTCRSKAGPKWHIIATLVPSQWFIGERSYPKLPLPGIVAVGFGPVQARRHLRHGEVVRPTPHPDKARLMNRGQL